MGDSASHSEQPKSDVAPVVPNGDTPKSAGTSVPPAVPIPQELYDKLPPQAREQIASFFSSALTIGSMPNPISQKVTPEHITLMIKAQSTHHSEELSDRKDSRRFLFFGFATVIASSMILICILALTTLVPS